MDKKVFKEAAHIISTLENAGYEAYFVGGSVRDYILQRPIRDIDIATSATPIEVQKLFDKVIPVGIEFGTVIVRHKGVSYEVTTYQSASTSKERHEKRTLKNDLERRDFTMNALAMNKAGDIIDLFAGLEDLQNRQIRAVQNATERFKEDPLRIVRALRFVSQLNFTIEQETLDAMRELKHLLAPIAVERVSHESNLLFQGTYVQRALDYIVQLEIERFLPMFAEYRTLRPLLHNSFTPFQSFAEVIAYFCFKEPSIPIIAWIKRWKCSKETKKAAINLLEAVKEFAANGMNPWLVYRLEYGNIDAFIHLLELLFGEDEYDRTFLQTKKQSLTIQSKQDLHINGHEIIQLFPNKKRGSWIEQLFTNVEYEVVMGTLENDKERIKEWIVCHPQEKN